MIVLDVLIVKCLMFMPRKLDVKISHSQILIPLRNVATVAHAEPFLSTIKSTITPVSHKFCKMAKTKKTPSGVAKTTSPAKLPCFSGSP
jgi:hypothetical protein